MTRRQRLEPALFEGRLIVAEPQTEPVTHRVDKSAVESIRWVLDNPHGDRAIEDDIIMCLYMNGWRLVHDGMGVRSWLNRNPNPQPKQMARVERSKQWTPRPPVKSARICTACS